MKLVPLFVVAAFAAFVGSAAVAQTAAPAVPAKPAVVAPAAPVVATPAKPAVAAPAATAAKPKMTPDEKKAKSKACSEKADAQKLHGKARKSFREKCKREA